MGRSHPPGVREKGETAYLTDSLKGAQSELTERYRAVDEVAEEIIGEWLDANPIAVTANQVSRGINWTPDSRSIYRITTVLKQMGYTRSMKRVRDGERRTWAWTPPGGPAWSSSDETDPHSTEADEGLEDAGEHGLRRPPE